MIKFVFASCSFLGVVLQQLEEGNRVRRYKER